MNIPPSHSYYPRHRRSASGPLKPATSRHRMDLDCDLGHLLCCVPPRALSTHVFNSIDPLQHPSELYFPFRRPSQDDDAPSIDGPPFTATRDRPIRLISTPYLSASRTPPIRTPLLCSLSLYSICPSSRRELRTGHYRV